MPRRCGGSGDRGECAPTPVGSRAVDTANLGTGQQIGEGAATGVDQRPEPSEQDRDGVQQVRQIAQHQTPRTDPGIVGTPGTIGIHHRDTEDRTAHAPPARRGQEIPVDRDHQKRPDGNHHAQPPEPALRRGRHRHQSGGDQHAEAEQHVEGERTRAGRPGRHRS